jgi:oligoribonuclease
MDESALTFWAILCMDNTIVGTLAADRSPWSDRERTKTIPSLKGVVVTDYLIWIDLEMTGLDPEHHVIVEIASVVTDSQLTVAAEGPDLAIRHPEDILSAMEPWSLEHHQASGLMDRIRASSWTCRQAEQETLQFLSRYCKKGTSPLCGNSIGQDRRFLVKHMPELEAFFHYRNIDVSSVKELVKRWYPTLPRFEKKKSHLALSDIRESISELSYYRDHVFVP